MTQLANAWNNWATRPAFVRLLKFLALSLALHVATLNLTVAVHNPGQPQGYVIRAELLDPAPVVDEQPEAAPQPPATAPPASTPPPARAKPSPTARTPAPQPTAETRAPTEPSAQVVAESPITPEREPTPVAEATPVADAVAASEPLAEAPPPAIESAPVIEPVIAAPAVAEPPPAPSAAAAPTPPAAPVRATAAPPPVVVAAPVREIVLARADETQLTQSATAGFALRHPDISATPRITPPQPTAEPPPVAAKSVEAAPEARAPTAPVEKVSPAPSQAAAEVTPAPVAAEAKQVPVIVARTAATSASALPTLTLPQRAQTTNPAAPTQTAAAREVAVIKADTAAAPVAAPTLTLAPRQLPPSASVPAAPNSSAVTAAPAQATPPTAQAMSPSAQATPPTAQAAPPPAPAAAAAAPPAASNPVTPPPAPAVATPPPSPGPSVDDVLPQPGQAPQQVASLAHSLPVPLRFESTEAALAALPKSARIEYVFRRGERGLNLGKLKLHWQLDGAQYSVRSEGETTGIFAIFFQGKHRMESRGSVTPQGLMPELFQEERNYKGRRLEQVAFDRANKALVYSNEKDTRSAPLAEGTQDILSILFQFALDPPKSGRFTSTFTTARKLETFEYEVSAQETLELAGKRVETIRLTPKDARGRASIEVWLAINDHHLPVKVRFVDRKGNITEQIATNIRFE